MQLIRVSGAFKWKWEVPEKVKINEQQLYTKGQIGDLALTEEGDLILRSIGSGAYYRALYGISKNGSTKFFNLDAHMLGLASGLYVGKNNTSYYYTSINGKNYLAAANCNSGALIWLKEINSNLYSGNNIAIQEDGNLYCAFKKLNDNRFANHIINGITGDIIWSGTYEARSGKRFIGPDGAYYESDASAVYNVEKSNDKINLLITGTIRAILTITV